MRKIISIIVVLMVAGLWSCKDETKVRGVSLDQEEIVIAIGETRQLELMIEPVSAYIYHPKNWKSSNENVATVDQKGNVTGVYGGECIVTVYVEDKKASCKVRVETAAYDLRMDGAVVYNSGVDSETGSYVKILRLFEEGLEFDSVGNASGNGLMLNLYILSPSTQEPLAEGVYDFAESKAEFTVLPGELLETEEGSYATGSFLGEYSDYGFGVLFVREGRVTVSRDGESYNVECVMEGAQNEHVEVRWTGEPTVYRADTTYEPKALEYSALDVRPIEIEGESSVGHVELVMDCGEESLRLVMRVPLTAGEELMDGAYAMSSSEKSFTAMAGECYIEKEGQRVDLVSVALTVANGAVRGSMADGEGRSYSIAPVSKKSGIKGKFVQEKVVRVGIIE